MKRFDVDVPATSTTEAIQGLDIKARDEEHARQIIAAWLGQEAAAGAIVRPVEKPLPALLRKQAC